MTLKRTINSCVLLASVLTLAEPRQDIFFYSFARVEIYLLTSQTAQIHPAACAKLRLSISCISCFEDWNICTTT